MIRGEEFIVTEIGKVMRKKKAGNKRRDARLGRRESERKGEGR